MVYSKQRAAMHEVDAGRPGGRWAQPHLPSMPGGCGQLAQLAHDTRHYSK
jgi:hypothetical protein